MNIGIVGAGAWGTGLAIVLGRKGTHAVRLWAHEREVCESIRDKRVNTLFLPDQPIPVSVTATNRLEEVLDGAAIVVSVMPSHHCRDIFERVKHYVNPDALFVSATKGI